MIPIYKHAKRAIVILLILSVPAASCKKAGMENSDPEFSEKIEATLNDFENRKKYTHLTPDIIKSIPDDKLETAILDYIEDVHVRGNHDREYEIIKQMNPGFQYIYMTWKLENEVNNGGFAQFFYNTSIKFNPDITEALNRIKAYKTEKIANEAIAAYNKNRSVYEERKTKGSMENFIDSKSAGELDRLDDSFYRSGENLSELRILYIRENTSEFLTR